MYLTVFIGRMPKAELEALTYSLFSSDRVIEFNLPRFPDGQIVQRQLLHHGSRVSKVVFLHEPNYDHLNQFRRVLDWIERFDGEAGVKHLEVVKLVSKDTVMKATMHQLVTHDSLVPTSCTEAFLNLPPEAEYRQQWESYLGHWRFKWGQ